MDRMNTDTLLTIVMALSLIGGLIAVVAFGLPFLRKSEMGKKIGLPKPRQRRINLIERAHLDNGRKLLLVRRDDVEHLVMIGGPIDVLVETGIQRPRVAYERPREVPENGLDRYQTDWGLNREAPQVSEKPLLSLTPEPSLSASRPPSLDNAVSLDQTPPNDSKSIQ